MPILDHENFQGYLGGLVASVGASTDTMGNFTVPAPVDADEPPIVANARFPFVINEAFAFMAVGSVNYSIRINGVAVTGLSVVAATTGTQATQRAATALNVVAAGDIVSVLFAGGVTPTNFALTLGITRT